MSVKGVGKQPDQPILPSSLTSESQIAEEDALLPADTTEPRRSSHADAMKKVILDKASPSSRLSQVSRIAGYGLGWLAIGIAATIAVLAGGAISKVFDVLGSFLKNIGRAVGYSVGVPVGFVLGIFSGLYSLAFGPQGGKIEAACANFGKTLLKTTVASNYVFIGCATMGPMIVCSFMHSVLVGIGSNILEKLQVPSSILDEWKKRTRETFSEEGGLLF